MEKCYAYDSSDSSQESQNNKRPVTEVKRNRTRGRPKGNPTPLNAEQRRERNAQYERERREEMADAMRMLAAAASFDEKVSNVNLLAGVVSRLRRVRADPPEDLDDLRRINRKLEQQIADAKARLMAELLLEANTDAASRFSSRHTPHQVKVRRKRHYQAQNTSTGD